MPAFRRTISTHTEPGSRGSVIARAQVDDWFHGFAVTLELRGGQLRRAEASTSRHPWSTCPGALDSVARLSGPTEGLGEAIIAAPRDTTCVHLNDLVWLASRQHADRRYDIEVTPSAATLARDGQPLLCWKLHHWMTAGTGRLAGLAMSDPRWRQRLDQIGADADLRESAKVMRRGVLVGMGYYVLEWDRIERGTDVPQDTMANTCHTFSSGRVAAAACLAQVPERRARAR